MLRKGEKKHLVSVVSNDVGIEIQKLLGKLIKCRIKEINFSVSRADFLNFIPKEGFNSYLIDASSKQESIFK